MPEYPKPYVDAAPRTKVLLRGDTKPPVPIEVAPTHEATWRFGDGDEPVDREQLWRGEGDRCDESFPPTRPEGSVRCELIAGHYLAYHWAVRSSV